MAGQSWRAQNTARQIQFGKVQVIWDGFENGKANVAINSDGTESLLKNGDYSAGIATPGLLSGSWQSGGSAISWGGRMVYYRGIGYLCDFVQAGFILAACVQAGIARVLHVRHTGFGDSKTTHYIVTDY
ncbi:MAG: hypothetical protein IBX56_07710, partial [Methylomicrobium sp.]|nr:hypothetical protein [Methylomicrobium sp.]